MLGAQAKTRWAIVAEGAKSLQTQDVFRTIVGETVAQSDVTITLSNMRTAITSTNVVLNMAISTGMILVPSDLIIQKEMVAGYNNVLTLATESMRFGKNDDVNYKISKEGETLSLQGSVKTALPSQSNKVTKTVPPFQDNTRGDQNCHPFLHNYYPCVRDPWRDNDDNDF